MTDSPGRPAIRRAVRSLLVAALVLALLWAGASWYFSGQIHADALAVAPRQPEHTMPVVAVRRHKVAIVMTEGAPKSLTTSGTWGLRWPSGYGQVTRILDRGDGRVVRRFTVLTGDPPRVGTQVAVDRAAFGRDPGEVLGLDYRTVRYGSPLGRFPAWFVPGQRDTWAVLVHGKDAALDEMLRPLDSVHAVGMPALVPAYRNDPTARPDPSGVHQFGRTEWRDLDGTVRYALAHGAEDVVLVGASMGGAIVAEFLDRSPRADRVAAVVMDSPLLDLTSAVDDAATRRTLPFTPVPLPPGLDETATWVAERRYGVDMSDYDHIDETVAVTQPLLVIHSAADRTAPVGVSDAVVATRRDRERPTAYVRLADAPHVAEWNVAAHRYDAALRRFLTREAR
ncbi:MAG: alpha/beta hydrolase family protein [Actinomycetes bacterium]